MIEHRLSLLPRRHPARLIWLLDLAKARVRRYQSSRQVEDLDNHLLHVTEAILLPIRPWAGRTFSLFDIFFQSRKHSLGPLHALTER